MLVLMEHDKHGRTHAYSQTEITTNISNGWRVVEDEPEIADKVVELENAEPPKRGRPKLGA